MSPIGSPAGSKILYLESLRGIAALTVVLHHFRVNSPITDNNIVSNAWLMVDFFFALSGFVIALNYQDQIKSTRELVIFQAKRFLRLYPLHIVMLLVFVCIELAKYLAARYMGVIADNPAFSANDLKSFLQAITLTQSIFSNDSTWNGPSWSISAEFYAYIIFGLTVLACRSRSAVYMVVVVLLSLLGAGYVYRSGFTLEIPRCIFSFFLGVLLFNYARVSRLSVSTRAVSVLALGVVVALSVKEWSAFEATTMIFPPLFGLMILGLVLSPEGGYLKTFLESRYVVYLGTISYGIYMIHVAVWWVVNLILRLVFRFPTIQSEEGGSLVVIDNKWLATLLVVIGVATILCLAHLSYKRVEMPINRLRHRLGRPERNQQA